MGGQGGAGGLAELPTLDDTGLIARYYIDEAASGQMPLTVNDAAPMPTALNVQPAGASSMAFHFIEALPGQRGIEWSQIGMDAMLVAAMSPDPNNKFRSRLNHHRFATLEAVIEIDDFIDGGTIFSLNQANDRECFGLYLSRANFDDIFEFWWSGGMYSPPPGILAGEWNMYPAYQHSRVVIHLVLDTLQSGDNDRVRLYVDGSEIPHRPFTNTAPPEHGAEISIESGNDIYLALGNRAGGSHSIAGILFYMAIYDVAFNAGRVYDHVSLLSVTDDRQQ